MSDYYTIQESDAGRYTFSAFGRTWTPDSHRVERGKLLPVAVDPAYIGKRAYPFTDDLGRECLQVEGTGGRSGRFTVVFENDSNDEADSDLNPAQQRNLWRDASDQYNKES